MLSLSQQLHSWLILPIQSFHIASETWLGSASALIFEMKATWLSLKFPFFYCCWKNHCLGVWNVPFSLVIQMKPPAKAQSGQNMESPANDTLHTPPWTSISLCWHAILRTVVPISNGGFDRRCAFHINFYLGGRSLAWENCGCLLTKWIFINPLIKWVSIKYYSQGRSRCANDEIGTGSSPMVGHHHINCMYANGKARVAQLWNIAYNILKERALFCGNLQ